VTEAVGVGVTSAEALGVATFPPHAARVPRTTSATAARWPTRDMVIG
jgi:hypothetical protein